jgi:hypothetical protein
MATKVKIQREFTFKAYVVNDTTENNPVANQHTGEFMTKSECHYYCEKEVLDFLRANVDQFGTMERDHMAWCIYKVCTLDDESKQFEDVLVETITIQNGMINIR